MKYLVSLILFLALVIPSLHSQNRALQKDGKHFLFTFKQDSYLISGDSLFCITKEKEGFPKQHELNLVDYKFVTNDSIGYLKNRSSGIVYSFDGSKFKRLDRSFPYQSQNFSFSFLYKNNLMDFGGYGLHTYKNNIIYFDTEKKETELYPQASSYNDSPNPRHKIIGQFIGNHLYIGPGYGVLNEQESPLKNLSFINDYWKFSFKDSRWEKLGEGSLNITFPFYGSIENFNQNTLVIAEEGVFECDIKNNTLITYPNAKLNITRTLNRSFDEYKVTYNKFEDKFYFIINKTSGVAELISLSKEGLLGTEKVYSNLYRTKSYMWFIILSLFVVFVLIYFYFTSQKTPSQVISKNLFKIREEIKLEDFKILKRLVDASPNYINYSELLDVFPEHYSYESKKKKTRQSILYLEEYLIQKIKLKLPVFEFRRNIEDRREKQIRIK
ncbi:hypothetical protein [Polaribacter marinaquae]|uniref:DUF4350 domain-containing protein n=1 Tax=Polaribacter marinaquae TaxID=1642819 RepID=A0ABZ2TTP7_9FLAO